ncbi:hypothetical protein CKA32_004473 [Geitlerinema sp. FC II]|nr:hypothetical protein CKA32_004473 [Geitlerinema sp. FC II]
MRRNSDKTYSRFIRDRTKTASFWQPAPDNFDGRLEVSLRFRKAKGGKRTIPMPPP